VNGPIPRIVWQDEAGNRQVLEDVNGLSVRIEVDGWWKRINREGRLKGTVPYLELSIALEACKALHERLLQVETELRAEKSLSALLEVRLDQARGESNGIIHH
jgi:hypothetical protein